MTIIYYYVNMQLRKNYNIQDMWKGLGQCKKKISEVEFLIRIFIFKYSHNCHL